MDERYTKARHLVAALKTRYWSSFRSDPSIVGAAFGRRIAHNEVTDHPAMIVYVMKKVPTVFLPPSRLLPRRMYVGGDCVEVDVVETGPIYPHSFTARERPAPSGISVGPPIIGTTISAGSLCILSCNHVLANENLGKTGDPILQPGSIDGGTNPADLVATLKRFQVINASGNTVDCAIAQVVPGAAPLVVDSMQANLMQTPNPKQPAVGLLFAGGCNRTFMNPISNVLSALNIQFLAGAGSTVAADIGMNVQKVGRTTEFTTSTIVEIDASTTIQYNFGPGEFDHQIATMWASNPGDSGSVFCQGGQGSSTDNCSCGTTTAGSSIVGQDLTTEAAMANQVRDKYLRQTLIGRYALDLFHLNEEKFLDRFRRTDIKEADKELARRLFLKHITEARQVFAEAENSERTLHDHHFADAREALKHAQKYMFPDEIEASEHLFRIAEERGKGRNAREILATLNDEGLLRQLKDIAQKVKTVRKEEGGPC